MASPTPTGMKPTPPVKLTPQQQAAAAEQRRIDNEPAHLRPGARCTYRFTLPSTVLLTDGQSRNCEGVGVIVENLTWYPTGRLTVLSDTPLHVSGWNGDTKGGKLPTDEASMTDEQRAYLARNRGTVDVRLAHLHDSEVFPLETSHSTAN